MPKNSIELKILNERRLALSENMENFDRERDRLQRKLNIIVDLIDSTDGEMAAIDTQLATFASHENFDVKLHVVQGEHDTSNPKLMVEIILDSHPPIFKLLSQYDLAVYTDRDNPTDKMLLKSRLIDLVEEWLLSNDRSISQLFSDEDKKLENSVENYVNDSAFDRRIRRAAAFFPIMIND